MSSKNLFIVDDEADLLETYVDILELSGYIIVGVAENGAEAVERFARLERHPDVIIMDYRIPIKNGLEAAREILEIDPAARFIFASADRSVEPEVRSLGTHIFLTKPFDMDQLIKEIELIRS